MIRLFFIFILLSAVMLNAQKVDVKSTKISFDIKFSPQDTIPPAFSILYPKPNIINNLPIYERDTVVAIGGRVINNSRLESILIDGRLPEVMNGDKFAANVQLKPGKNLIVIKAINKRGYFSEKTIDIYQDKDADLTPPEINIISPELGRGINVVQVKSTGDTIKVIGKISDNSGLYGTWINDIPISLSSNNEFSWIYTSTSDTLHIKAVDKYGNASTKIFYAEAKPEVKPDTIIAGNFYALIIAEQKYHDVNIPDLDYPVSDAKGLENALENDYTFDKKNVIFLENPDRAKIIKTLDNLSKKLISSDNLIIYYAGHGVWDADLQQGFWLPSDATSNDKSEWLSNGNIRDYIRGIKTKHTLLIADACFGGAIFKTREILSNAPVSIKKLYEITSRSAMTSGTLTAVPDKSIFVKYLVKRLTENENKYLSADNLFSSIREAVINNSPTSQTPQYGVIYESGDEGGGSFIFIHK